MAASILTVFVDLTSDDDDPVRGVTAASSSTSSNPRPPLQTITANQKVSPPSSKPSKKRVSNLKPSHPSSKSKKPKSEAVIQDISNEYSILSSDGITSVIDEDATDTVISALGITEDELNTVTATIDAAFAGDDHVKEEDVVSKIEEALEDDAIAKDVAESSDKAFPEKTRDEFIDALIKDIRKYTWANLKIHNFSDQELDALHKFANTAPSSVPRPVVTIAPNAHPSFGDKVIDDKHAEFIEALRVDHDVKPASVIKCSGLLTDPLLLGWHYPPENHRHVQNYGTTADPLNSCMRVAGIKLVGDNRRTTEGLSQGIMMVDHFAVRQEVPKRAELTASTHYREWDSRAQPYDVLPKKLLSDNALHYDWLCDQSQATIQVHLGERNCDDFYLKHEGDSAHFKPFSISKVRIFRSQRHGCVEYHEGLKSSAIKRIHFFVHHTESQFYGKSSMKLAELLDKLWNTAAMIIGHTNGNQSYYQWRASYSMRNSEIALSGKLEYWETFCQDRLGCLFEIRKWEKDNDIRLPLSETPAWMIAFEEEQALSLTHTTRSLAGQILLVYCTRGNRTQAAGGWEGLVRGRATAAANGHLGLVRGRAVVDARRAAGVTKQQIQVNLMTTLSTDAYEDRMAKNAKRTARYRAKTGGKPKKQWSLPFIKNTLRIYDEEPFESWNALARKVSVPGINAGNQVKRWVDSRAKYDAVSL